MAIKVLVDGFYLSKPRGLGRYVRELISAINSYPARDIEIHVVIPRNLDRQFMLKSDNIHYHSIPYLPFPLWEQVSIPLFCRKFKPDILHSGYNTMPVCHRGWKGQIEVIQDLMFFNSSVGTTTIEQLIGKYYRMLVVSLVQSGRQTLLTTTDATARDVRKRLGRSATTIPIPVSSFGSVIPSPESPCQAPYFLHIGGTQPHKNTVRTVDAFLSGAPPDHLLVIAGVPADWNAARFAKEPRILVPGWIDDVALATYYQHAVGVIFPSLFEGFGLPTVEAFAYGRPLITSDRPPMSDLAGDAALLVDPENIENLAAAISKVSTDHALREKLSLAGRKRAKNFAPEIISAMIYSKYREVVA